jgi:hypothetical protein
MAAPMATQAEDDFETELPFDEPPWDPDPEPPSTPTFKPISKARRDPKSDQEDLPFDLD